MLRAHGNLVACIAAICLSPGIARILEADVQCDGVRQMSSESKVFQEVQRLAKGEALSSSPTTLPVPHAIKLTGAMKAMFRELTIKSGQALDTKTYQSFVKRFIYRSDGKQKMNSQGSLRYWTAPGLRHVRDTASEIGLRLKGIRLIHEDAGLYTDSRQDTGKAENGFWMFLGLFEDKSTKSELLVVAARGTMALTEVIADIGMYQYSVTKDLPYTADRYLFWPVFKQLASWIPGLKERLFKNDDPQENLEENANLAAESLLKHSMVLVEGIVSTYKTHSNAEQNLFGGLLSIADRRRDILVTGHSLGGAVASIVGLGLKARTPASEGISIAGITTNSPQVGHLYSQFRKQLPNHYNPSNATGFLNLVMQHDVIWKIGDAVEKGETTCMYMHPAEDSQCRTGNREYPRWEKLAHAIRQDCALESWRWLCTELFTNKCWSNEHNIMFPGSEKVFGAPMIVNDQWKYKSLRELMSMTGETIFPDKKVPNTHGYETRTVKEWRLSAMEELDNRRNPDGLSTVLATCCGHLTQSSRQDITCRAGIPNR
jgi:hypothetical protein